MHFLVLGLVVGLCYQALQSVAAPQEAEEEQTARATHWLMQLPLVDVCGLQSGPDCIGPVLQVRQHEREWCFSVHTWHSACLFLSSP